MSNSSTVSSPAAFSSAKRPAQSPLSSSSPSFVTNSSNTSLDTLESTSSKKSFSAKLKKAFSFGRGSNKTTTAAASSSSGGAPGAHRARKPSIGAQSTKSAFVRSTDASDAQSVMSAKSTQSAVSLTSLKRMSRSFFSKKHKQDQDQDDVQSPTLLMPHLKGPATSHQPSPLSAVSANPVLSHSVAEAEIPPTPPPQPQPQQQLTVPPKYGGFAGFAPPTPPPSSSDDCTTIRKSEESESRPIPSLSSSATCSSDYEPGHHKLSSLDQDVEVEHDEEEEDDVTSVGDTVFPKKLDVVTVETIRSSLERTKSLERRRSRRSTKSAKSEKSEGTTTEIAKSSSAQEGEEDSDDKETIPNPTEVHVHDDDISVDLNKDMPAPKSILKSSTSSEKLGSSSSPPNNNTANDDNDQKKKPNNNANDATSTTLDMINFDVLDSDLNLDFNFEKLPDSLPEEIDQEDMDGAKKELEEQSKIEYQYQPMQYEKPHHHKRPHSRSSSHRTSSSSERHTLQPSPATNNRTNQFYHPLYQKRISQFVPSHNNNNASTASASSSSASSIFSRPPPPPEKKTHAANNATVSFSSRIVIYDTYDRSDYDRRAELATCNRLTPILAQQIKEELNNFKMEMDIHADSRIYTHFF